MDSPDVVTVGEAMALLMARQPGPLRRGARIRPRQRRRGAERGGGPEPARFPGRLHQPAGQRQPGAPPARFMLQERLDLRHVRDDERHPTGFMLKEMAADGSDPEVEYFRRGSAASHMSPATCRRRTAPSAGAPAAPDRDPAGPVRRLRRAGVCAGAAGARGGPHRHVRPQSAAAPVASQAVMVDGLNALASLADVVMPGLAEGRLLTGRQDAAGIADFYLRWARARSWSSWDRRARMCPAPGGSAISGVVPGMDRCAVSTPSAPATASRSASSAPCWTGWSCAGRRARQRDRRARGAVPRRLRRLPDRRWPAPC
jgi:2-dehydro-3-deoxygluconokinase